MTTITSCCQLQKELDLLVGYAGDCLLLSESAIILSQKICGDLKGDHMQSSKQPAKNVRIDCHKCAHFYVTWEKQTPYGCRGHSFKSAQMPSNVVFAASKTPCLLFTPKR